MNNNLVLKSVIKMKHNLEKLVNCPEGELKFTDNQVQLLLGNIGNLNPVIRDDLVYTLLARGFLESAFTHKQEQNIVSTFIKEKDLFKNIAEPQNDSIFLRSFSALLGSVILEKDKKTEILTDEQRKQLFAWSIDYLLREKDYRGFVAGKGWAHSVAHGSDFLGAALSHPKFLKQEQRRIMQIIPTIFKNINTPFVDDEEQRLAFAFYQGVKASKISLSNFIELINQNDIERYQELQKDDLLSWHKLSTWLRLLQNWYFFFDSAIDLQLILKEKITNYFSDMGYE